MATLADLIELGVVTGTEGIVEYRMGAFETPPISWGTLIDPEDDVSSVDGLEPPYFIVNAFGTEGLYVEPTKGQIWPRIG